MSEQESDEQAHEPLRLSVSPDPTDDELLAILQALRMLESKHDEQSESIARSEWQEIARHEGLRVRNWPAQVRGWARPRR